MDRLLAMQAFVRLVELGTFTATARELHVKQSTVSKWLASLESELGVSLLERTTRSQRVTEAGLFFYEQAREMVASYEATSAALQEKAPEPRGRLRVSVPVVFGGLFVTPIIGDFLKQYKHIDLDLQFSDRYVNLVEEGFDMALRVGQPVDSVLKARKLGETERLLVASPDYLATYGVPEVPEDLKEHQALLHAGVEQSALWVFHRGEERVQTRVSGRFCANHSATLKALACEGLGLALLASWLVKEELASGRLVPCLREYRLPPAPVYALMGTGRVVHPRVRVWLSYLEAHLGALLECVGIGP